MSRITQTAAPGNIVDRIFPPNEDRPQLPSLVVREGAVFANSRDVAKAFEKRHDHVLRDIDTLCACMGSSETRSPHHPNLGYVYFQQLSHPHPTVAGREIRSFDMTRDGFALLAMGFTGAKALRWKLAYMAEFNRMEATLHCAAPENQVQPVRPRRWPIDREWFLARLRALGLSQAAFARAVGMSRQNLSKVLSGDRRVLAAEVGRIAEHLVVDVSEVLARLAGTQALPAPERAGPADLTRPALAGPRSPALTITLRLDAGVTCRSVLLDFSGTQ